MTPSICYCLAVAMLVSSPLATLSAQSARVALTVGGAAGAPLLGDGPRAPVSGLAASAGAEYGRMMAEVLYVDQLARVTLGSGQTGRLAAPRADLRFLFLFPTRAGSWRETLRPYAGGAFVYQHGVMVQPAPTRRAGAIAGVAGLHADVGKTAGVRILADVSIGWTVARPLARVGIIWYPGESRCACDTNERGAVASQSER